MTSPAPDVGAAIVAQLASDLQDPGMPPELNRLGRTLWRRRTQISAWHAARVTNAATEAGILWSVSGVSSMSLTGMWRAFGS